MEDNDEFSYKYNIEKLKGHENYDTWKVAAAAFLHLRGLYKYVEAPLTTEESDEQHQDLITRSEILLLVDKINYRHIDEAKNAHEAWTNLQKAFEECSVKRKVAALKAIVSLKSNDCESLYDYVDRMMLLWSKVKTMFNFDEETGGYLMLTGVSDEYRPLKMAIEHSQIKLTVDKVKSYLLHEASLERSRGGANAMQRRNKPKSKREKSAVQCFKCGEMGHYANKCNDYIFL